MNSEQQGMDAATWLGLRGKVAVVTGAGSGIGAETARQMAALGVCVALLDRDAEAVQAVAGDIRGSGLRALGLTADVSEPGAIAEAATIVEQGLGPCDLLVNNAALIGYAGPLMEMGLPAWNRTLEVNLTGALICSQAFGGQMISAGKGGCILNVASICGHFPLREGGAYSVGKSGLMMLTQLLALELADHGIRCNSVSPSFVVTPASAAAYNNPEIAEGRRRLIPTGRISMPLDIANVIILAASDRAGYINGQDILVDGAVGRTLMNVVPRPTTVRSATD